MERRPPAKTVSSKPEYPGYASENTTQNSESDRSSGSLNFDAWLKILSLLIAPLGLLGNGAVLWLLGFRIRRTPFSVYILNLAAADALFLCSSFLNHIDGLLGSIFDYVTDKILLFLKYMSYTAGLSLLAAISTERCLSVLCPLWYRCRRPKHTSAAVCTVVWSQAWMLELLIFGFWHNLYLEIFTFFTIVGAWFLFLTSVMCVSSLTLLLRVQCSSQRRRPPRLTLLVLLTVLVFLLCGLPWGIWTVLYFHFHIDLMLSWICDALACVNSSVNPLIYFFVGRLGNKRKEPLRVVLQRALGDHRS